jgi:hypothetical protein
MVPQACPGSRTPPVFLDGPQIRTFYDAVVGPAFRTVEMQISADRSGQVEKSVSGPVSAGLLKLFPWLRLDTEVDAGRTSTSTGRSGTNVILQPVESAARQLVELSLHYLVNQPGRICQVDEQSSLPGSDAIAASPRMIAFIDAAAGTRFLPQAAELNDGRVVTFFDPLVEALRRDGGTLPVGYPDDTSTSAGKVQRDAYWNWFADHWNLNKAVKGRVAWGNLPPRLPQIPA